MKRRVMEVLNQVGLGSKAKYYPDQLSGGENSVPPLPGPL